MMKTHMLGCDVRRHQRRQRHQADAAQDVVADEQQPRVDLVGEPARRDRADDVEDADHREQRRGRRGGHAVVVRGRDEVGGDEAVGGHPADREAAGRAARTCGCGRRRAARRARGRRSSRPAGAAAGRGRRRWRRSARSPRSAGWLRRKSRTRGMTARAASGASTRRRTPAVVGREPGDDRQEDQLAGGVAGGEDAADQAAAGDEPAAGDGGDERHRHRAGAEPDEQAPAQDQLPRLGHEDRQAAADRRP